MQILIYFFKAFFASLAIQMPIGPVSMLCINKTLEIGFRGAVLVGIGATLADCIYASIAALGLSTISDIMNHNKFAVKLFGGLFLLYLAYKETGRINLNNEIEIKRCGNINTIIEAFFVTLISPMTILSFMGIFASLNLEPKSSLDAIILVVAISLGSIIWWLFLGAIMVKIKNKLSNLFLKRIKWISCFVLAGFGIFIIFDALSKIKF